MAKQMEALFEAGLCGLCSCNGLAQRAFEAASSVRDKYEQIDGVSGDNNGDMNTGGDPKPLTERGNFLLNMGDLSFHLGHSYLRSGKLQYSIEEAGLALSYYGHPAVNKEVTLLRHRMTLSLRALAHTMRGADKEAEDDLRELERGFKGPVENGGQEMASVRSMIARRARRGGVGAHEGAGSGGGDSGTASEKKPVPVVAAAKPPTALQQAWRAGYRNTARNLDRFLAFMTGDHWTSVVAAWLLIVLSALSVASLAH